MHRAPPAAAPSWRDGYDETLFGPPEERSFPQQRAMGADALVEWAGSTSGVVNATRAERARVEREIRRLAAGLRRRGRGPHGRRVGAPRQLTDGSSGMRDTSS